MAEEGLHRVFSTDFVPRLAARYGLESDVAATPPRSQLQAARDEELLALASRRSVTGVASDFRGRLVSIMGRNVTSAASARQFRATLSTQPPVTTTAATAGSASNVLLNELAHLRQRERVAEILNSAFRNDLEELIALHRELAAQGIQAGSGGSDAVREPPRNRHVSDPLHQTGATRVPEGLSSFDGRLGTLEGLMQRQQRTMEEQQQQLQRLYQLLASSFSLGLSLQEQQARSVAALSALTTRLDERTNVPPGQPSLTGSVRNDSPALQKSAAQHMSVVMRSLMQEVSQEVSSLQEAIMQQQLRLRAHPGAAKRRKGRARLSVHQRARAGPEKRPDARSARALSHLDDGAESCRGAGDAAHAGPNPPPSARLESIAKPCLVCEELPADAVLYRCGHRCACLRCAHFMRYEQLSCPLCRAPIDDVIRVFE